jgi:hypothetical protein
VSAHDHPFVATIVSLSPERRACEHRRSSQWQGQPPFGRDARRVTSDGGRQRPMGPRSANIRRPQPLCRNRPVVSDDGDDDDVGWGPGWGRVTNGSSRQSAGRWGLREKPGQIRASSATVIKGRGHGTQCANKGRKRTQGGR